MEILSLYITLAFSATYVSRKVLKIQDLIFFIHFFVGFFIILSAQLWVVLGLPNTNNWILFSHAEIRFFSISVYLYYIFGVCLLYFLFTRLNISLPSIPFSCASGVRHNEKYDILIFIFVAVFINFISDLFGYFAPYVSSIANFALVAALCLCSRYFSIKFLIFLVVFVSITIFVGQALFEGAVNRGGVIKAASAIIVFKFFSRREPLRPVMTSLTIVLGGALLLSSAQVSELIFSGQQADISLMISFFLRALELRNIENLAYLLWSLDMSSVSFWGFTQIYNVFVEVVFPFANSQSSSSSILQNMINSQFNVENNNAGYGFGLVAEGFMISGLWSVLFISCLSAIILRFITVLLDSNSALFRILGSYLFPLSVYMYRADLLYISKVLIFSLISFFLILYVRCFMHRILNPLGAK